MSWLTQAIPALKGAVPEPLRKIGDSIGGFVVSQVPGGSVLNNALDLTNTRGTSTKYGGGLSQIVQQTGQNIQGTLQNATTLANAQNQTNAIVDAFKSPVGMVALGVLAFVVLRRK